MSGTQAVRLERPVDIEPALLLIKLGNGHLATHFFREPERIRRSLLGRQHRSTCWKAQCFRPAVKETPNETVFARQLRYIELRMKARPALAAAACENVIVCGAGFNDDRWTEASGHDRVKCIDPSSVYPFL